MTNSVVAAIIADLNAVLADLDAEQVVKQKKWAAARVIAIKEFKASEEVAKRRADRSNILNFTSWYYGQLFAIAGGKTWYNVFNGRSEAVINEFVEKNCAAIVEKHNASIARKLAPFGVSSIVGKEYVRTSDGFHGTFQIETDKGRKTVGIRTIYAGGYNIQCAHTRTLIKVWA